MLIVDYSVQICGYRSDFTNTIAVGEPTANQQHIYEICKAAMENGEGQLKAGSSGAAVYQAVSSVMEESGYPPMGHHAGHGIGLGHPESPILVPESTDTLMTGDVVTLEPGCMSKVLVECGLNTII